MTSQGTSWKTFLIRVAVLCLALGVTLRVALARDGVPGGAARSYVTIAGTVSGGGVMPGSTVPMSFTFHERAGAMSPMAPCTRTVSANIASDGTFAVEVPTEDSSGTCPGNLFDGRDVQVDVTVGSESVVMNQPVNPVPYAIHADVAAVAMQHGTPECPLGYTRYSDAALPTGAIACRNGNDEMVRVGTGPSAFWIDRYEASVWQNADGTGMQYGAGTDYPASFPLNGQWTAPLYAVSKSGVLPSTATWFQLNEACRASGKQLPSSTMWLTAGRGTVDPGASSGTGGTCNTSSGAVRAAGMGLRCQSSWGAQDMIGNALETTDEWYVGLASGGGAMPWPADYNGDVTYNIASRILIPSPAGLVRSAVPAIAWRGGDCNAGAGAGLFFLDFDYSPATGAGFLGFRCVRTR